MNQNEEVDGIITQHVTMAIGAGFIPLPLVDFTGVIGIQTNMLKSIARIYDVPFIKGAVTNALTSLAGKFLFASSAVSLIKTIPLVGQTIGSAASPLLYGTTTYATGKVFTLHFDEGGTFLTFDTRKMKSLYAKMLQEGKQFVMQINKA